MQEECSVDTVQMLVGQLKTREQELAKKGRIVDYEREAALAGVRTMIHDLDTREAGPDYVIDAASRDGVAVG